MRKSSFVKFDSSMSDGFSAKLFLVTGVVVGVLVISSIRTVPPATVAVITTFGKAGDDTLDSGLHFIFPLSSLTFFSTKTILLNQENHVPTKEGLTVELDVAVLYKIDKKHVRDIYLSLGEKYDEVVIQPELASAVRGLTSESDAKALYTEGRSEMQNRLKDQLGKSLLPRGIIVEDVLLKAVTLPELLKHSIELKAQAEQDSARMSFVLDKERQEAERKSIEAKGIADFQKIVSDGISPQLLKWKAIEATEKLAESPNSKIVVMGNTEQSLPVLLSAETNSPLPTKGRMEL
jgi:prohibitin 1